MRARDPSEESGERGGASTSEGCVFVVEPRMNVFRDLLPGSVHFIRLGTLGGIPWCQPIAGEPNQKTDSASQGPQITKPWPMVMGISICKHEEFRVPRSRTLDLERRLWATPQIRPMPTIMTSHDCCRLCSTQAT